MLQGLFTAWVERQGAMLAAGALLQGCELQLYEDPDYLMIFRHALLSCGMTAASKLQLYEDPDYLMSFWRALLSC